MIKERFFRMFGSSYSDGNVDFLALFYNSVILIIFGTSYYWLFLSKKKAFLFGKRYSTPIHYRVLKRLWATFTFWRYGWTWAEEASIPFNGAVETEKRLFPIGPTSSDVLRVLAFDQRGNSVCFSFSCYSSSTEITLEVKLNDGTTLIHTAHPNCLTVYSSTQNNYWEGGGLKFETLEPLKRFRFTFKGLLRDQNMSVCFVRLHFIWSACGEIIDLKKDWHPNLMSEALAQEPWHQHEWYHLLKDQGSGFDQWGAMLGQVIIDNKDSIQLNLPSLRQRRWGPVESKTLDKRLGMIGFAGDGTLFYIRATTSPLGLAYAKFGHVYFSDNTQGSMSKIDISLQNIPKDENSCLPNNWTVSFTAKGRHFRIFCTRGKEKFVLGKSFLARLAPVILSANNECGKGMAEFWCRVKDFKSAKEASTSNLLHGQPFRATDVDVRDSCESEFVLDLQDPLCQVVQLTGGKGASLATLASVSHTEFEVPKGFCLTVNSIEKQIMENECIAKALQSLSSCDDVDREQNCKNVQSLLTCTRLNDAIASKVAEFLENYGEVQLAVRSSAVGEDSDELSAAGQNATFLGVRGLSHILASIQRCWASAFSFQSVQYRRQHGQPVICKMGVVLQEMVPAEKAGVIFSRDPTSGDPRRIIITANYGLGETVVSGEVDTDTIEISRTLDDRLSIQKISVGVKKHRIILSDNGTIKEDNDENASSNVCLSENEMLRLAEAAVKMDKFFNGPRDLEWAINGNKIFLLQARPITSIDEWTDFELLHEMDSPVVAETDISSIANTGEVFPGATSVLTLSTVASIANEGSEGKILRISHHHVFLDLLRTLFKDPEANVSVSSKIGEISVMGHEINCPELNEIAVTRNGIRSKWFQLKEIATALKVSRQMERVARDSTVVTEQFKINTDLFESAADLHKAITLLLPTLRTVQIYHTTTSRNSFFCGAFILGILTEGRQSVTDENLIDMSSILSVSAAVVSTDVPSTLNKLANLIRSNKNNASEFVQLPPSEGVRWLAKHEPTCHLMLQRFLKRHGHRGIKEFDLKTDVWSTKPDFLIETLQKLVQRDKSSLEADDDVARTITPGEIVDRLHSPLQSHTRSILKYLIKVSQKAVMLRETTKANLLSVIHQFRLGYRKLGLLMVADGFLPKPELIFHLTHYEMHELIRHRKCSLIVKAVRRQRLWSQWDALTFPEIMLGLPKPEKVQLDNSQRDANVKIKGSTVYPGNLMGKAVVIMDVKEIGLLSPGDILITRSTDIGWSPCFPILGGLVTELGGLISHGAVIAREYGLPCIVGAQGATSLFKTGDTVLLSGGNGTIEKISE